MTRIIILILSGSLMCSVVNAGWVIVERTTGAGLEESAETTLFIQGNKVMSVESDQAMVFDIERESLTIINHTLEGYWSGTPSQYSEFVRGKILAYLEAEIESADDQDRLYLQAIYDDLVFDMSMGDDAISFIGELPVEIIMGNEVRFIHGFRANHYRIYVAGELVERVWFTRDVNLNDSYDFEKFRSIIDRMSWGGMFQDYRSSTNYIHLMRSGLPLRTEEIAEDGSVTVTEILSVENREIPASDFQSPQGYRRLSLSDISPGPGF